MFALLSGYDAHYAALLGEGDSTFVTTVVSQLAKFTPQYQKKAAKLAASSIGPARHACSVPLIPFNTSTIRGVYWA
jgi:hypothetical protein